ncbi:WG repeat-containing protein [Achromobacter mucicolens]|uniref:WG repeat-containing protein n=1 Tax=Achromobacter mucicolens TaxID=1389922 RepID=UPI002449CE5F|nr:WG repeat-containing protein [Achromobacter mucicolens]MDH0093240.1 WG repeat-containing protein [Achromobacter mucicolens]
MAHSSPHPGVIGFGDAHRPRAVKPGFPITSLAVAAAFAGFALLPLEASADWRLRCDRNHDYQGYSTGCHRSYQEGFAAVLAGTARANQPAWGYLDKSGAMAIDPAFESAKPFQNGLAPVSLGRGWGYIDTRGRWVIEPRFAQATGFNANGTAIVRDGEHDVLIDRKGKIVKTFPLGVHSTGFQSGQTLAPIDVPTSPRLFNTATRKALKLPHDVHALAAPLAGGSGLFPASSLVRRHESWWGLLHPEKGWTVTPLVLRAVAPPVQSGDVLAVKRERYWYFFNERGEVVPPGTYNKIELLSPGLWLAHPDVGAPMLLDGNLDLIHTLDSAQTYVHKDKGWHYAVGGESTILVNPRGGVHVLPLRQARVEIQRGLAWVFSSAAQTAGDASADVDNDNANKVSLVQIYDRDGGAMLDDATVKALRGYRIDAFRPAEKGGLNDQDMPLALVRDHSFKGPLSVLTASGKLVGNEQWQSIETYYVTMPLLVKTKDWDVGAIAGDGTWAVPPVYRSINGFKGPYTWAFTHGGNDEDAVLIDASGKKVEVPAMVMQDSSRITGDLLPFGAMNEHDERRWGVWDIRKGALAFEPAYEQIEAIDNRWALAKDKGRWGVVDPAGRWVVAAAHQSDYDLKYLGHGMMSVTVRGQARTRDRGLDIEYHLINLQTGKSSAPYIEEPRVLENGLLLGKRPNGTLVLLDAQGRAMHESDGEPKTHKQFGDWLYMAYDKRQGAIDARGNMKVPPVYDEIRPFFVQPEGVASARIGRQWRIIDQTGKSLPSNLNNGHLLASMQRVVISDSKRTTVLRDLQGREIADFPDLKSIRFAHASEGVVPYEGQNRGAGFINAAGKRVTGPHFSDLGPLKNGLARARLPERTGSLHGYIDLTGRYAIAPVFTHADDFREGRALVKRGRFAEFIDTKGNTTARFENRCGTLVILNAQGEQSWPPYKLGCHGAPRDFSPPYLQRR